MFHNTDIDLGSLPEFEHRELHPVETRYPWISLSLTLALLAPICIAVVTAILLIDNIPNLGRTAVIIIVVAFALWMNWYSYKSAAVIGFAVRQHDVAVRRGVFWVRETIQPINRVQHVERIQGPVEKRFRLARLRLFSAGTGNVTFEIPGLNENQALQLQQLILERKQSGGSPTPLSND